MPKRTLAADYTIPQALEADLRREDEKTFVDTPQLKDTLKQDRYQNRRFDRKIDMQMDRIETYRDRMEVNDLEREEKRVQGILDEQSASTQKMILPRQRKIRWDVTPEQYEARKKEEEQRIGEDEHPSDQEKALIANVPIIGGVPLTDEVLDLILPSGYVAVKPPKDYQQDKSIAVDINGDAGYYIPPSDGQQDRKQALESLPPKELADGLEYFKEEDMKHFGKLTQAGTEATAEERKDTQAMKLILKIKNGNPQVRKKSMRQISENATYFGPKILFSKILPIIVEPNLEDHERHVLVKVIGRILQRLGSTVRPFTFKIVVLISPLLIEEDLRSKFSIQGICNSSLYIWSCSVPSIFTSRDKI
jgi:splicing factor 3B subunit 1